MLRRGMRGVVLAIAFATSSAACTWPEHRFAEGDAAFADAAASDAALDDASDAEALPKPTECAPSPLKQGACEELRELTGAFVADGAGDEFCRSGDGGVAIPPRRFSVKEAARTTPSPAPSGLAERVEVRAGLSAYGVHVFVQVLGDPRVLVDRVDLVQGDAVEIHLRGSHDRALTGAHEDDDAHHLVLTPPGDDAEGLAARYLHDQRKTPIDDAIWHSRRVVGGWEVELHYPWTTLGNQAAPGMTMGFDVAVDVKDDPGASGREVRALLHYQAVPSSPSCDAVGSTTAEPWCDDRTWCIVKAYVP